MDDSFSTEKETRKEGASPCSFPWPEHESVFVLFALKMGGKYLAGYKTELPACMYVYVFVCVLECVAVYRVVECILNV